MKLISETQRLLLREFSEADAADFFALNNNPEVLKYTGDQPFESVEACRKFILNYQDYQQNGFGRWALIKKETGKFIGFCGLKLNEEERVDLGFRIAQNEWRKGFATEAATACLHLGFESYKLSQIIGRASIHNKASIAVLEKVGMKFWKYGSCEGIKDSVYYYIDQKTYKPFQR